MSRLPCAFGNQNPRLSRLYEGVSLYHRKRSQRMLPLHLKPPNRGMPRYLHIFLRIKYLYHRTTQNLTILHSFHRIPFPKGIADIIRHGLLQRSCQSFSKRPAFPLLKELMTESRNTPLLLRKDGKMLRSAILKPT